MFGLTQSALRLMGLASSTEIDPRKYSDILRVSGVIKGLVTMKETPTIGIICGSGLGEIGQIIKEPQVLEYSKIPGFPKTSVVGHKGNLVFGYISSKYVVCLQGRFHPYEHKMDLALCAMPVRIMHELGVKILIVSNAAGGVNDTFERGDLMLIQDHICMPALSGLSPLVGLNSDEWGPRFVSLHDQYDQALREKAKEVAKNESITMREGVYVMSGGPQYESAAEIEFLKRVGGDALGMSTCHEVIVARQCGIRVVGMSLISNIANSTANPTHAEVIEAAKQASEKACKFVSALIGAIQ